MNYNKDIDNYNKGEGHGASKNPKPDSKFLKILLQLLIVGVMLFYIYNYRADISKYFDEIKVKIENALDRQSNSTVTDKTFVVDTTIVEVKHDEESVPIWIDDDPVEYDEAGVVSETPIEEQTQENPKTIDTPTSPIADEVANSSEIVLETFEGRDGKEGLRDKNTKKVYLEPLYDRIGSISNKNLSLWTVKLGNKYGWLEPDGTPIVPIEYDEISYLLEYGSTNHNPHLVVRKGNKKSILV